MGSSQRIEGCLPQQLLETFAFGRADVSGVLTALADVSVVAVDFQQTCRFQQVVPLLATAWMVCIPMRRSWLSICSICGSTR